MPIGQSLPQVLNQQIPTKILLVEASPDAKKVVQVVDKIVQAIPQKTAPERKPFMNDAIRKKLGL